MNPLDQTQSSGQGSEFFAEPNLMSSSRFRERFKPEPNLGMKLVGNFHSIFVNFIKKFGLKIVQDIISPYST